MSCKHTIGTAVDEDGLCISCGEDLNHIAMAAEASLLLDVQQDCIKLQLEVTRLTAKNAKMKEIIKRFVVIAEALKGGCWE